MPNSQQSGAPKVIPKQPVGSIPIPSKGRVVVNSAAVPSSGTVTPPEEIAQTMQEAAKKKIFPPIIQNQDE